VKVSDPIARAKAKAAKSSCRFLVAAIGQDRHGTTIGITSNSQRFSKKGGSLHAEMALMKKSPRSLAVIYVIRLSRTGKLLPIEPCASCLETAAKRGIKIISVTE
jgi:tRNA(Arg) A34 adenosine deaminase TadA